nr:MAG TPA: hypothetical protein [Caudoviricetes sp.]
MEELYANDARRQDCLKWSYLSSLALEKVIRPFAGLKDQNIKYILFVPRPWPMCLGAAWMSCLKRPRRRFHEVLGETPTYNEANIKYGG